MPNDTPGLSNPSTAFIDAAAVAAPEPTNQQTPAAPPASAPAPVQPAAEPPAPAPTPSPAPAASPSQASPSFLERAQQAGVDLSQYESAEQLVDGLFSELSKQRQALSSATAMLQQQPRIQPVQGEPPQPPAAPPLAAEPEDEWNIDKHFDGMWEMPQYDPEWDAFIQTHTRSGQLEQTANGYVPTPGNEWLAAAPQLQKINAYEMRKSEPISDLFYKGNFYRNVYDRLQEPIDRRIEQRARELVTQVLDERRADEAINQFEDQHRANLYEANGDLSERGQKFFDVTDQIRKAANDPVLLLELASQLSPLAPAPTKQAGETPPAPALSPEQASLQKYASFLEDALSAASHEASATGTPPPPGQDAGFATEQEVRTAFTRRMNAQAAA